MDGPGLLYTELMVSGEVHWEAEEGRELHLVLEEEDGMERLNYWSQVLKGGRFEVRYRIPRREARVHNKLYIWDPRKIPFRLTRLTVEAVHVRRPT